MAASKRWSCIPWSPSQWKEADARLFDGFPPRQQRGASIVCLLPMRVDFGTVHHALSASMMHSIADCFVDMSRYLNLPAEQLADQRQRVGQHVAALRHTAELMKPVQRRRMHSAERTIQMLLVASRLRNASEVRQTVELCLGVCFPWLAGRADDLLGKTRIMSKSAISWHQLTLDAALMRLTALEAEKEG